MSDAKSRADARPPKRGIDFAVLGRAVRLLFAFYPRLAPIAIACIVFAAVTATLPAVFLEQVTTAISECVVYENGALVSTIGWAAAADRILPIFFCS